MTMRMLRRRRKTFPPRLDRIDSKIHILYIKAINNEERKLNLGFGKKEKNTKKHADDKFILFKNITLPTWDCKLRGVT